MRSLARQPDLRGGPMMAWVAALDCRGALRFDEPMSKHCTWRAGGVAALCFEPIDRADLLVFLRAVPPGLPIVWIGLGSNVLIRDAGFPGAVILTSRALGAITRVDGRYRVEAGVPCAKLARQAAGAGYTGGEFLVGIPGTIGGALAMNAGAFGSEIWQWVRAVETVDRAGLCRQRRPDEYRIGYRSVRGPAEEWFLSCELELARAGADDPIARGRELLVQRGASQPTGAPSCGSVFRNPPGDYAGRLIEAAGFKGYRIGGCHVSDKHANFIINDGDATATDIETLIGTLRAGVQRRFGIDLEPEVRILGTPLAAAGMAHD